MKTNMRLVGGPPKRLPMTCYEIINAQASESRLMGVVSLYVHWKLKEDCPQIKDLEDALMEPVRNIHQAYCFELEDGGLDRVSEELGTDTDNIAKLKDGVFGGLGSRLKKMTPREALWLIENYSGKDALEFSGMPAGVREVFAMAKEQEPLAKEEERALQKKLCVRIYTDFAWVHYYIMRSVCHDFEGASLTVSPYADPANLEDICLPKKSGLVRSRIDVKDDPSGNKVYLSESVVDTDKGSSVILSEIMVGPEGVISAKQKGSFALSEWETYRKLLRPEYLTYFEIDGDLDEFDQRLSKAIPKASCKIYDTGNLYMEYNPDNNHVEQPIFNIGDDLRASYYITTAGHLVMAAFTGGGILAAETTIRIHMLDDVLKPLGRFTFTSPVLGRFVESGYDDFKEFLDLIV